MSAVETVTSEVFARLGLHAVDADLTAADGDDLQPVDDSVIVLSDLSVEELKLFAVVRDSNLKLDDLQKQAVATMLKRMASRLESGDIEHVPGVGFALAVEPADVTAALPATMREEFFRLNTVKDAAKSVMYLTIRQRLNCWGESIEIRRGGQICMPRNPESN